MKILLWLAVPVAVACAAMVWAAWYGRRGSAASGRGGAPSSRPGWGPDDPAYERFRAAVSRPLPSGTVQKRQALQPRSGVVVRRGTR